MAKRIGNFFIFLGIILLTLFVYTDMADSPYLPYAVFGAIGILLGMILRWSSPTPPPPPANRFNMLRKKDKRREEKRDRE